MSMMISTVFEDPPGMLETVCGLQAIGGKGIKRDKELDGVCIGDEPWKGSQRVTLHSLLIGKRVMVERSF